MPGTCRAKGLGARLHGWVAGRAHSAEGKSAQRPGSPVGFVGRRCDLSCSRDYPAADVGRGRPSPSPPLFHGRGPFCAARAASPLRAARRVIVAGRRRAGSDGHAVIATALVAPPGRLGGSRVDAVAAADYVAFQPAERASERIRRPAACGARLVVVRGAYVAGRRRRAGRAPQHAVRACAELQQLCAPHAAHGITYPPPHR